MGFITKLSGLATVLMPEGVVKKILNERDTYRGQTIDAKALAVGRFAVQLRGTEMIPTVADSREQTDKITRLFDSAGPKLNRVKNLSVPGAEGQIKARLYSQNTDKTTLQPAMVFFHGGGFVQGNLESHNGLCTKLAGWSGGIVIAVDYRLAPEHPYPQGIDDAIAAYLWIVENAVDLGIDPARIGVGGDSAGGCFAAVLAQQTVKLNQPVPAFQVLVYPVVDSHLETTSINELSDAYILPKERMIWYRDLYRDGFDDYFEPKFSPLYFNEFAKLPKSYVLTGGFDPLCDDGIAFVEKLTKAGVATTHRHFPGQIHAFLSLTKVIPQGDEALQEIALWLKENW